MANASSVVGSFLPVEFGKDGFPTRVEFGELPGFGDGRNVLFAFAAADELDAGRVAICEPFPADIFADVGNCVELSVIVAFLCGINLYFKPCW